jgi:hypothetical protein
LRTVIQSTTETRLYLFIKLLYSLRLLDRKKINLLFLLLSRWGIVLAQDENS